MPDATGRFALARRRILCRAGCPRYCANSPESIAQVRFATDSLLEGGGFEPSVPPASCSVNVCPLRGCPPATALRAARDRANAARLGAGLDWWKAALEFRGRLPPPRRFGAVSLHSRLATANRMPPISSSDGARIR